MTSFKLYTENVPEAITKIAAIVTPYYDGFNIASSYGVWHGVAENCLVVEIITDDIDRSTIGEIAESIRIALKQDAVLVSETKLSGLALVDDEGITDLDDEKPEGKHECDDCENCTDCEKQPEYVCKTCPGGIEFEVWMDGLGRLFAVPRADIVENAGSFFNPYTGKRIHLEREQA